MTSDDLTFSEAEAEFIKAFVTILEHLHRRAIKAEREIKNMQGELNALRDKVEYLGAADDLPAKIPQGFAAPLDERTTAEMMHDRDQESHA